MSLFLELKSGPFVLLAIFYEASIGIMVTGYITSKRLCAVSPTHFLTSMMIATPRTSGLRLTAKGSANARSMDTTWLESIREAATSCTVLSGCFVAR